VFLTAIESLNRVLSIPANGVFQNLVVDERAVADYIVDSVSLKVRPPELAILASNRLKTDNPFKLIHLYKYHSVTSKIYTN
jgi:hypothetical protein